MKTLILALALISTTAFAEKELSCEATYRLFTPQTTLEQVVVPLVKVLQTKDTVKFNGELEQEQTAVSATIDVKTGSVMLTMVKGPDYVNGILSRSSLINGFARLTRTDAVNKLVVAQDESGNSVVKEISTGTYTLYKVECYSR